MVDRFGTTTDVPLTVPLDRAGNVSVVGPREDGRAAGGARPADPDRRPARARRRRPRAAAPGERSPDWEWLKWLPHLLDPDEARRPGRRPPDRHRTARPGTAVGPRPAPPRLYAAEVRRGLSGREALAMTSRLLVVSRRLREAAADLPRPDDAVPAAEMGVTVLHLLAEQVAEADQVAVRVTVDGDQVRVEDLRGEHPVVSQGTVDDVADRRRRGLARMLAPLRLSAESVTDAPLAGPVDFTEVLGIADPGASTWPGCGRRAATAPSCGCRSASTTRRAGAAGPEGVRRTRHGPARAVRRRDRLRQVASCCAPWCSPWRSPTPPEDLALVLVDYKGGATFARSTDCRTWPAVITNLEDEAGLIERVHASLAGEIKRRQQILEDAGDVADIARYAPAPRSRPGPAAAAAPVRGHRRVRRTAHRQAGLHRPVPVRSADRPQHRRAPAAVQPADRGRQAQGPGHLPVLPAGPAHLLRRGEPRRPRTPRRLPPAAAARLRLPEGGHLRVRTVQGRLRLRPVRGPVRGRTRGRRAHGAALPRVQHTGRPDGAAPATRSPPARRRRGRADRHVGTWSANSAPPPSRCARIWLPPLPASCRWPGGGDRSRSTAAGCAWPIGGAGRRCRCRWRCWTTRPGSGRARGCTTCTAGGHTAVVGGPQSGKTTLLRTLALSLALTHTPREVRDLRPGPGRRRPAGAGQLPHVGGVAGRADRERVARTVAEVRGMLAAREEVFREHGIDSVKRLRAAARGRASCRSSPPPTSCCWSTASARCATTSTNWTTPSRPAQARRRLRHPRSRRDDALERRAHRRPGHLRHPRRAAARTTPATAASTADSPRP